MGLFKRKTGSLPPRERMPRHIAIIMDGNGRWAKKRGLPRSAGHAAGAKTFRAISEYCDAIGIAQLSVFAFSTENWSRPAEEVEGILNLLRRYLDEACRELAEQNVQLRFIGRLDRLPADMQEKIGEIEAISAGHTGLIVNVCLNYGGRADILDAAKAFGEACAKGEADPQSLDEAGFARYLYTRGEPDPDLLIRTGDEKRISNFMLWQAAYAELYFTPRLWPDYAPADLNEAIRWFAGRNRRFGGVVDKRGAGRPDK